MRILVVAPPWLPIPPVGYGGTELVLDTLCRGLVTAGHDVLLYATGDSTCPVPRAWTYEEHLGIATVGPAAEVAHCVDAYGLARRWRADIVHDHTITGPVWAEGHAPCPVVTTNHGPFADPLRTLYSAIGHDVGIIAISHHQAATAGDIPVVRVIHHGLDLEAIAPGPGDGGYALFLGRMSPDKGVHLAIEVARRAGVPLRIAAKMREPAERAYFEQQVEPNLGPGVEFVGEVAAEAKQELLAHALCLLNPITWPEPFGMVMLEALAAGTPVVGTACGAADEIVERGVSGLLHVDLTALSRHLELVEHLDRAACRRRAETAFSMERMAADHVDLYETVADHGARPGVVRRGELAPPAAVH